MDHLTGVYFICLLYSYLYLVVPNLELFTCYYAKSTIELPREQKLEKIEEKLDP